MLTLIPVVILLPLVGFVILGLFGSRIKNEKVVGWFGSGMVGIAFLIALGIFFELMGMAPEARAGEANIVQVYSWLAVGDFSVDIAYLVDPLSILFTLIITGVGFLIHVYSIGYMHGDESFPRFFAYLNLFIFMMLNLVLASNFLLTFLGWEGVGLASYLLIGFWYKRKFPGVGLVWTGDAARKAFVANRVGDFGMLIAMFILFTLYGSLDYLDIAMKAEASTALTAATLLLFLGCTGKSAQIPLFVWLPDAMAGPTSVSALIHAATMVTSGIFLVARNATLFALTPATMEVIAIIGVLTALFAATMGIFQNDIKKVLAYSTVSQLGFMFAALGVGAFGVAVFHVMTHAFFKACLFLGSGSVIHSMHEEQNIQKMGGLKKHMPSTYWTFFLSSLAISGIPIWSGFFSKDEILWKAFSQGGVFLGGMGGYLIWGLGALAAFCTAFYMFRLVYLTFHGKERFDVAKVHPHESPATMTFPLWVLAGLATVGGFIGVPHVFHIMPNYLEGWLDPVVGAATADWVTYIESTGLHIPHSIALEVALMFASVLLALVAIFIATRLYGSGDPTLAKTETGWAGYKVLFNKYYVDEMYQNLILKPIDKLSNSFLFRLVDVQVVDGLVNGTAALVGRSADILRRLQTGIVQNYAMLMLLGIVVVIVWMAV